MALLSRFTLPVCFTDTATTVIYTHSLHDALPIYGADAEDTHSPARVTIESDGFDLDTTDGNYNGNGTKYVSWQWKANGGTTASNSSGSRSEEHTSELQSRLQIVCRLLLEKKKILIYLNLFKICKILYAVITG